MYRSLLAGVALAAVALPTSASASIIFTVSGTFVDGGTFSGMVKTSDNLADLEDFSITTAGGTGWPYPVFPGATYTKAAATAISTFPNNWIQASYADGSQMRLYFAGALTASGVALDQTSAEFASKIGSRWVTGGSLTARVTSAVPEPATWALMILGFGLVGGALRSATRRQKTTVTYA